MVRIMLWVLIFSVIIVGCAGRETNYAKKDIIKVADFELSPDESKIAFSAITPAGNLDIWVVDIEGKNLKKLTFQDRSPTNRIAGFFKRHRWRNFFEIDMCYPKWTDAGRVAFCQQLSKTDAWSSCAVSRRYWTIKPDGKDKRARIDSDKILQKEQASPINKFKFSDRSEIHKTKIFLKNNDLWILKDGEGAPYRLIQ